MRKSSARPWSASQPMLPMGLGYVEGVTHDYVRHGTTTLFAALDIANGQVLTHNRERHRHQEFLGFLRQIDKNVPEELEVHVVLHNYATHKHAKVKGWVASHPRFHFHFTAVHVAHDCRFHLGETRYDNIQHMAGVTVRVRYVGGSRQSWAGGRRSTPSRPRYPSTP